MVSESVDDPRLTAIGLLIEVYEGVMAWLEPVRARHGLCGNDVDTLIRLARADHGRLRMTDLATQTSLSTSGITRVVDRLERSDLARREPCPTDRRSSFAVLTEEGEQRLRAVLPQLLQEIETCFTGPLGRQRLAALTDALQVVREVVHPGPPSDARSGSWARCPADPADPADQAGPADLGSAPDSCTPSIASAKPAEMTAEMSTSSATTRTI